jgi:hypothetical protein
MAGAPFHLRESELRGFLRQVSLRLVALLFAIAICADANRPGPGSHSDDVRISSPVRFVK